VKRAISGVCGALSPAQLVSLNKQSTRKHIESGAELIGESQEANSYANIISGVVKLTKMMADGRQQIVGLQFAPRFSRPPVSHRQRNNRGRGHRGQSLQFPQGRD
jgi:CRP/FNR family transcriptional regulator